MFSVGAFAIILDSENKILLSHRRDYDLWNLPGGGMEKGESPWECMIREVKEETNLDVQIEKLTGIYYKPDINEIIFSFLCKVNGGELLVSEEADQHKFFSLDDIPKNTSLNQIERIKDYFNDRNKLFFKLQKHKGIKKASG